MMISKCQDPWAILKRPNPRVHRIKEGNCINAKGVDNLFSEIITLNPLNLEIEKGPSKTRSQIDTIREETLHDPS